MATFGSPFRSGSLSSIIFAAIATLVMIILYTQDPERDAVYLLFICVGLATTLRHAFKCRKLRFQLGHELIGDMD
jgi:hypothetical protein